MRKQTVTMLAIVMILALAVMASADEKPWFDFENCSMCKPIMAQEGLMQGMTYESFPIYNGMMGVSTVPAGLADKFAAADAEMDKVAGKLMAGEKMYLCGMCTAFMAAMDSTVHMEKIKTKEGQISLTTSDNPETAAKLQEIAKRNQEEMAKMAEAGAEMKGHEGHGH